MTQLQLQSKSVGSECAVYFVDGVRIVSIGSSGGSAISMSLLLLLKNVRQISQ